MSKQGNPAQSVLLLGLAVAAVGGGAVFWQFNNRSDAEAKVSRLRQELPDESQIKESLEKSKLEVSELQNKLTHLEQGVPGIAYVPTLLKELEQLGLSKAMQITGVRPNLVTAPPPAEGEKRQERPYQELEIDITGRGSYQSVMEMVKALQSFPKIVAVQTVGLTPRRDGTNYTSQLDASVRLKAYMFREGDKKAGAEEPKQVATNSRGGSL
ncbi:MAG: type 4a pilus biogenesis protein PilO [Fimbriimonadaceae bacterium]|jgi:Tfp pilus assembly protein PilO|nr:type 4a pilus biogenesis protein PilO [Fimbriimonadaceae bacterium]